jgi:hypothetical protein
MENTYCHLLIADNTLMSENQSFTTGSKSLV